MRRNDPHRKLKISKTSAAKRQLETAIGLWFNEADPVSIHTLGVAAGELLHHLGRLKGKPSLLRTSMAASAPASQRRMQNVQNFFKYASRDAAEKIGYFPYHGELVLYDAVLSYDELFKCTPLMRVFMLRMVAERRTMMRNTAASLRKDGIEPAILAQVSRREFLDKALPSFAPNQRR